jgi:hypothetical protein
LPDLTPEQAQEVKQVLGQIARDPNALTDTAVLEGLEPAQRDAVLLLLKDTLPLPAGETDVFKHPRLDPELFPPEEMDQIRQQFDELYEHNPDLAAGIRNPLSPTDLPPFEPVPPEPTGPGTEQPGLTEAEQQALRDAGFTPEQIEWVQGKTLAYDRGEYTTLEALALTDQQWDVLGGIWENHPGPVDQQPPPPDWEMNSSPTESEDEPAEQPTGQPELDPFPGGISGGWLGDVEPIDADEVYEEAYRRTVDEPDEGGVAEDPSAPGEALNPELFDPLAPGPTLDTGLAGRIEQNPQLVREVNQNEDVARALERDPSSLEQIEQDLGLGEQWPVQPSGATQPAGMMDWGLTDPSLGEAPLPEQTTAGQDLDDTLST